MIRSSNLPKIVFLQGPPSCGKDTIADLLNDFGGYEKFKFAQPIIDAMRGQFPTYFNPMYGSLPPRTIEEFKKHNFAPHLNHYEKGLTPEIVTGRDIMIAWSEQFMKPLFGSMVFGTIAAKASFPFDEDRVGDNHFKAVFSDSGFEAESIPVLERCPRELAVIIQVYRPGHNFSSDSRSYWSDPAVATFSYMNALEGLDAFQKDFIKFFNSNVFSYHSQSQLRSPSHA